MENQGIEALRVDFGRNKWSRSDWLDVKSARWDYVKQFIQEEDHIVNPCPDLSDEEIYANHVTEIYASMVYNKKFEAKAAISSVMSFDHLMAPLIVIAPHLGQDAKGRPEFREHHEVVLYNEGINVWHYTFEGGKPQWHLAAFLRAPFEAKKKHELTVTLEKRRGQVQMDIYCGGHHFGYQDETLPESFYTGITACEGRNRFYNFKVRTGLPALDPAADGEH
jgi:hypothetical protein